MDKIYDIIYWNDLKDKLKQNYPILTTADLQWRYSTSDDLLTTIADKFR
ncbi:MAG: hypothetical protein JXB17_03480 [Bacteroidales bacterium]|nr:hypothetical protein [Bacteroidales bacterium]